MAQLTISARRQFHYQNFVIDKTHRLGHGAYGAVYKAKCDELPCAAKLLHPTILDPMDPGSSKIAARFQQECDFMSDIRHPNITQYLGMDRDPETGFPVLLMELLDESLTAMLERSNTPLPYHLQVDICQDVALAIAYLHKNGLVHRDLSSNNVLMLAGQRAKVTDFGMSKLTDAAPRMTPLTMCPGTSAYMPPEALSERPTYTEKIDCFSEGVLIIQVCTRKWPDPGPRTRLVPFQHSPTGMTEVPILETERRESHIKLIQPTHPLLAIATPCIDYDSQERPSAQNICRALGDLKSASSYRESFEQNDSREKDRTIDNLQTQLDNKSRQIAHKDIQLEQQAQQIQEKDELQVGQAKENEKLRELIAIKDQQIQRQDTELALQETQLQEVNQKRQHRERIAINVQVMTEGIRTQFEDLKLQVKQLTGQEETDDARSEVVQENVQKKDSRHQFVLKWDREGRTPANIYRGDTVINGSKVYFKSFRNVYAYDFRSYQWESFSDCVPLFSSMAVVRGLPTVIGGKQSAQSKTEKRLVSLTRNGEWVERFPPMPTARCYSAAISTDNHLIVVGGSIDSYYIDLIGGETSFNQMKNNMHTVEVLDTTTLNWSKAANLPFPSSYASITICSNKLYLLGGYDQEGKTKSVLVCALSDLIQTCQQVRNQTLTWLRKTAERKEIMHVWHKVADTPMYRSTCVTINDQLVTIGGFDSTLIQPYTCSPVVHKYNPETNVWEAISQMNLARSRCFAAVLPGNKLMVAGGRMDAAEITDSVEFATIDSM